MCYFQMIQLSPDSDEATEQPTPTKEDGGAEETLQERTKAPKGNNEEQAEDAAATVPLTPQSPGPSRSRKRAKSTGQRTKGNERRRETTLVRRRTDACQYQVNRFNTRNYQMRLFEAMFPTDISPEPDFFEASKQYRVSMIFES